ncbi:unnamed protein product, partial [Effrenium voratum]
RSMLSEDLFSPRSIKKTLTTLTTTFSPSSFLRCSSPDEGRRSPESPTFIRATSEASRSPVRRNEPKEARMGKRSPVRQMTPEALPEAPFSLTSSGRARVPCKDFPLEAPKSPFKQRRTLSAEDAEVSKAKARDLSLPIQAAKSPKCGTEALEVRSSSKSSKCGVHEYNAEAKMGSKRPTSPDLLDVRTTFGSSKNNDMDSSRGSKGDSTKLRPSAEASPKGTRTLDEVEMYLEVKSMGSLRSMSLHSPSPALATSYTEEGTLILDSLYEDVAGKAPVAALEAQCNTYSKLFTTPAKAVSRVCVSL